MGVSVDDPRPPYVQVADDLRAQITAGKIRRGQRLPSVRDLSRQYGIAQMTVNRSLEVLRNERYVSTQPGIGTFVAWTLPGEEPEDAGSQEEVSDSEAGRLYYTLSRQLDAVQHELTRISERVAELERAARKSQKSAESSRSDTPDATDGDT